MATDTAFDIYAAIRLEEEQEDRASCDTEQRYAYKEIQDEEDISLPLDDQSPLFSDSDGLIGSKELRELDELDELENFIPEQSREEELVPDEPINIPSTVKCVQQNTTETVVGRAGRRQANAKSHASRRKKAFNEFDKVSVLQILCLREKQVLVPKKRRTSQRAWEILVLLKTAAGNQFESWMPVEALQQHLSAKQWTFADKHLPERNEFLVEKIVGVQITLENKAGLRSGERVKPYINAEVKWRFYPEEDNCMQDLKEMYLSTPELVKRFLQETRQKMVPMNPSSEPTRKQKLPKSHRSYELLEELLEEYNFLSVLDLVALSQASLAAPAQQLFWKFLESKGLTIDNPEADIAISDLAFS